MGTRHLYLARHGAADAFGELTDIGRRQAGLLGERLAASRSTPCGTRRCRAPPPARTNSPGICPTCPSPRPPNSSTTCPTSRRGRDTPSVAGFFDGYDATEAASGHRLAEALVARFATDRPRPRATPTKS